MNRKELSEVVADCAAITEQAAARTEVARAGVEAARGRQEEAIARQEAVAARHSEYIQRSERRSDEMIAASKEWTERVVAELQDQRDERRALIEALFRVMDRLDRLPPPPPNLRSA